MTRIGESLVVPTELEAILVSHPNVADGAIFKDKQGKISGAILMRSGISSRSVRAFMVK